jgi:hypothetical protein
MTANGLAVRCWVFAFLFAIAAYAQAQPAAIGATKPPFLVQVDAAKDEFCLIMVPDTQRYTAFFPDIMRAQFRWIRDVVGSLNVKYVVHVGDVTEDNSPQEWILADEMFSLLDGVVPYTVVPGNHDIDDARAKSPDRYHSTSSFNAVFSPKRFAGRSWWGGNQAPRADNSFGYFKAGGQQFMVLGLEYGPTDETLGWANSVTDNHADQHKVIVVTHSYMDQDDTRLGEGDNYSPHKMNPKWNDGEQMWEKFVRRNGNIVMVLCGHVKGDGTGLLVSKGDKGNPVVQMLANYQFMEHGGQGWLRILKFKPREKKLDVFTYSPWLQKFREEPDQRFTVDVPHFFP